MIEAKVIADSVDPIGQRITTFVVKAHRFILAEFNTHRMLSRNSASSRAIPSVTYIKRVAEDPAMPVFWGKLQSGMQAKEELDNVNKKEFEFIRIPNVKSNSPIETEPFFGTELEAANEVWLQARDNALKSVEQLSKLGLHKQIANRLLEPWVWQTILTTATDWENFFSLRAHPDAQPEFQALAYAMLEAYNASTPRLLQPADSAIGRQADWHIPFGDRYSENLTTAQKLKVATARAARVSYVNFEGDIDHDKDYGLHDKLAESGHWSPFEHAAMCVGAPLRFGNFKGWKQYRKFFENENRKDDRVKKYV